MSTTTDTAHSTGTSASFLVRLLSALEVAREWMTRRNTAPDFDPRLRWIPRALFAVVIIVYPIIVTLQDPAFVLGGQMWAEMATNYFPNAHSDSLLIQLFATDFGYIPLPQRLIALVGSLVGLGAGATAYFYTFAAMILGAALVATICLPTFRSVIQSDVLRFILAALILLLSDFESRTFINFTYFAVVPLLFITALAFARGTRDIPAWAWAFPIFLISKPAVLGVLPAMVIVALVSGKRFRWITAISAALGITQAVRLVISLRTGETPANPSTDDSFIVSATRAAVTGIGRYTLGPDWELGIRPLLIAGILAIALLVAVALLTRGASSGLTFAALSVVLISATLNAISFPNLWQKGAVVLENVTVNRLYTFMIWAVLILVVAMLSQLSDAVAWRVRTATAPSIRTAASIAASVGAVVVLLAGFTSTGWTSLTAALNGPLTIGGLSQWHDQAGRIDASSDDICVPIEPMNWYYAQGCGVINAPGSDFNSPYEYRDQTDTVAITIPDYVADLDSFALLVTPDSQAEAGQRLHATAEIDSSIVTGTTVLAETGSYVSLAETQGDIAGASAGDVIHVTFDIPVRVAWAIPADEAEPPQSPTVIWMGTAAVR
jgi:hypothetical protein